MPALTRYSSFAATDYPGLALWLRADSLGLADGEAISTWTDESGLGNHATGVGSPILKHGAGGGHDVVRLSGSGQYLTVADAASIVLTGSSTTFVVCSKNTTATRYMLSKDNATSAGAFSFYQGARKMQTDRPFVQGGPASVGPIPLAPVVNIAAARISGTVLTYYLNGAADGRGSLTNAGTATGKVLLIGAANSTTPASFWDGDIGQIVNYNVGLSDDLITRIMRALGRDYTIPTQTPRGPDVYRR